MQEVQITDKEYDKLIKRIEFFDAMRNRDCKKSCVYKGNFFPDMNQICKNLLSDSVIFMLSNFLYSHSITSSYGYIHLFSFFCIPTRH